MHLNYGPGRCEWVEYPEMSEPSLYDHGHDILATRWIEDRAAERAQAMLELRIEALQASFCTDGN